MIPEGIGTWVRRRAVKSGARTALVFRDVETGYAELSRRIDAVAGVLRARGIREGDRVAYLGGNHPSFIESMFATTLLGAIFVPLNTRLSPAELNYQLGDSGARLLIAGAELAELADGAVGQLDVARLTVRDGQADEEQPAGAHPDDYERALRTATPLADPPRVTLDDRAVIIYTSGTTGRPKGAVLTHGNLTWNALNAITDYDYTSAERTLIISPMFHVASFGMGVLPTLLKGGAVLLQERFVPGEALAAIERLRATFISGVPTTYQFMMEDPAWSTTDIGSLRSMTCGGSAIPERVIRAYAERGLAFSGGYGMPESWPRRGTPPSGSGRAASPTSSRPSVCATPRPGSWSRSPGAAGRSRPPARTCSSSTGGCPRRPRRRSPTTAGSARGTSGSPTTTGSSRSSTG